MFKTDCIMIFLPIQLCLWVAGHMKSLVPDPSGSEAQPATPEAEMQTTDLLADYTKLTLAGQQTAKGKAKGSKRSAPGDDAPLVPPTKQNMEPKVPKILKRVILFSGPSLFCTDAAQKNGFPFRVTKDQRRFLEDWAQQGNQASNHGV